MFTGILIALFLLAGVITAVGSSIALAQRRALHSGKRPHALPPAASGEEAPAGERRLQDLRPGDIVSCDGVDHIVEGVIGYREEAHCWVAGRLSDGDDIRWLVVGLKRGDPAALYLLDEDGDIDTGGHPPEMIVVGQTRYRLDTRGTATAERRGNTGIGQVKATSGKRAPALSERCRWWLYETPGAATLVVEQWGEVYRALRGQKLTPTMVELLPGT